ncbi:MAG TPA: DinB family protein [Vicinamibacterales bacterium]
MAAGESSPPWRNRLIGEFADADARAIALVAGLDYDQLNWRPAPDKWSIGLCLEHLCITNDVYGAAIGGVLASAPKAPVPEITPGWFSRYFIRSYIAPGSAAKTSKAPPKIAPVSSKVELAIVDRFLRGNQDNRVLLDRAASIDVNRVRFPNPFVPLLRFTAGTGFEILAKHESRHLLQAERVKGLPEFPGPSAGH